MSPTFRASMPVPMLPLRCARQPLCEQLPLARARALAWLLALTRTMLLPLQPAWRSRQAAAGSWMSSPTTPMTTTLMPATLLLLPCALRWMLGGWRTSPWRRASAARPQWGAAMAPSLPTTGQSAPRPSGLRGACWATARVASPPAPSPWWTCAMALLALCASTTRACWQRTAQWLASPCLAPRQPTPLCSTC